MISPKPILIAGPCSAESREQVLRIAESIKNFQPEYLFRAGVWKPRTRPNSFEGVGESALPWLTEVQQKFNVPVITEVANSKHVELCLKAGVSHLWIGARTTVNPFAVQEICDALKNTDTHLYIKNPINPDLALWMGGIERAQKALVKSVSAIFRGFHEYSPGIYRNVPSWEIVIELKRRLADLKIICDPSHISGKASLVKEVSQKAMDMGLDGLMIETHLNPKHALSDPEQQITPEELKALLNGLRIFSNNSSDPNFTTKLELLRKRIDELDGELLRVLSERMKVVREIGHEKKHNKVTILQIERYDEMMQRLSSESAKQNLDEAMIKEIFSLIHQNSIDEQQRIIN